MNRYKQLLSNTAVFTAGKFISKMLVFFMVRFYTAYLTTAEYSTADLITNMANLLIPLACLGIGEGVFRKAASGSENREQFFTNGIMILMVGSAGFLVLSPLLGLVSFFEGYVWLLILYVVVSNIHTVCSQYLCACGEVRLFAFQGILNTALTIGLNILFLPVFDMGVTGYVLSIILADGLVALFLVLYGRLWRAFKTCLISWPVMKQMLSFCLPLIPTTVFWWVTSVSDRYLVASLCSSDMNGLYAAAYKVPNLLVYAVSIFDSAFKLSVAPEQEGSTRTSFFTRVWRNYITITFIGGMILILCCKPIAGVLFAEGYQAAWVYIPLLSAATIFTALDTFLGSVYYTCQRTMYSLWTALVGAVLNIVLNILLIPPYGAMGAAVATFVSYYGVFFVRLYTIRRMIPFRQERLRCVINTAWLLALTVSVSMTDGYYTGFWWFFAGLSAAGLVCCNLPDMMRLFRLGINMVRPRRAETGEDME